MKLIKNICYRVIMLSSLLLALMSDMVTGDTGCSSCGFHAPTTHTVFELECPETGDTGNSEYQINWSDGSYSIVDDSSTVQIAIGSCCSQLVWSAYATGNVTDGKFVGQPVIRVTTYHSDNEVCDECQTSSGGITRATGDVFLAIGTKGVGQWIECTGILTYLFSPALTPTATPITYLTYTIDYNCSSCVESC